MTGFTKKNLLILLMHSVEITKFVTRISDDVSLGDPNFVLS